MTVANGFHGESTTVIASRRCRANLNAALMLLLRRPRTPAARAWPISARQLLIATGAFVLVLLFVMAAVDGAAIRAVTRLPPWAMWPFEHVTNYGLSGWFLWPLGVLFLALAALPAAPTRISQAVMAAVMVRVGFLFLAVALPGLFATTVKRMIGRARPLVAGHIDPFTFSPFIWRFDYAGLPSGHTTTAFSVLVAFGTLWPRARTWLLLYAVLIAASRVMVLQHYPSDVLAGAAVGVIGVMMVRRYFALRRLLFTIGPDGKLSQYPGPSLRRLKTVARELLGP